MELTEQLYDNFNEAEPEELPMQEDVKLIDRKLKSEKKKLDKEAKQINALKLF